MTITPSLWHSSGDKVIYSTNGSNKVIAEFSYDSQGNPATMTYNGVIYYYHIDGHGNVTAMTDAAGNTVAQYNYDAWGNPLTKRKHGSNKSVQICRLQIR